MVVPHRVTDSRPPRRGRPARPRCRRAGVRGLDQRPLAHLPPGHFAASASRLTPAAMAHNVVRAAACLASQSYGGARGATIRRDPIDVAARTARTDPGLPDPAPAARLAPPGRMGEPVPERLRATRLGGLTRPDQVTHSATALKPPAPRYHRRCWTKPQDRRAAGKLGPPESPRSFSVGHAGNDHLKMTQ